MLLFLFFLLGLAIGSFLNCLVYRLNNGSHSSEESRLVGGPPSEVGRQSFLIGRSFCPKCQHQLAWRDNIPLLSFILLRGRCRYCQAPISWQYPLVELATALLTVFVFCRPTSEEYFAHLGGVTTLLIVYALVAIFVSDLLYLTIPDVIVWPAIGLVSFAHLAGVEVVASTPPRSAYLLAGLAAAGFFLLLVLITKGRGMGLGDVKLAALMGLFLGWPKILVAFYVAFLTGALVGVILILLKKKKLKDPVSFGPFLVTGTLVSLFWGEEALSLILNWF